MTPEVLKQANEIQQKLRAYSEALNCFEHTYDGTTYTLHPSLIIEYDDDGRAQVQLPMVLSDFLIDILKSEIKNQIAINQNLFDSL